MTGQSTAQVMWGTSSKSLTPNGLPPFVMHHKYVFDFLEFIISPVSSSTDQWRATAPSESSYFFIVTWTKESTSRWCYVRLLAARGGLGASSSMGTLSVRLHSQEPRQLMFSNSVQVQPIRYGFR